MLYKLLGICLSIGLCSYSYAQETYSISGIVVDARTQAPISGANIVGSRAYAVSANDGTFIIKKLQKGSHMFKVTYLGYAPKEMTIEVSKSISGIVVELNETDMVLEEVELHGKTKNRQIMESPIVTIEASKEFMDSNRENSLMQTLDKIPGVSTINIGSGQSKPVIRGLGFNRVGVVQNGIKHEAQQWGSDHGLEIDQYGIDRIQIVKGPASLMYGSDAIAGVVDIKPSPVPERDTLQGEVNLLAESNNDLLGISGGVYSRKGNWFYRGRLTYRDYGDYKVPTDKINYENYIFELHDNYLRNTAGREANASFSLGFISGKVKTETFISNVNAKNGFFANAHGLEVRTSSIDYDASNRDIDLPFHNVNHFKLSNSTTINLDGHRLHFDVGFQNNYREEHSEPVPHGYMPKPPNSKEREFNKNTYTFNVKDDLKAIGGHAITTGLQIEFQDNGIGGWGFLIPAYKRFMAGVFVYDQYEIQPDFHLQAGLRYDYGYINTQAYYDWYPSTINNGDGSTSYVYLQRAQDKDLNFGNFSGSVGLSYIHKNTTYKLNLGKSFRMPLANELASDGVNYHMYRYEKGNLELDPEESYQIDVEIGHDAPLFNINMSPFVNYFNNFIYLNPTPNYYETLQIYEYTQSKVFRYGGEVQAGTRLFNRLKLGASAEYVHSEQVSGEKEGFTIPFSPPLSGLFSASYQFYKILFLQDPVFTANYRITAKQEEIVPPEEVTDGYQVLNVSLQTKINVLKNTAPLQVRFKLNNVFGTKYYNHTSFYRLIDVPEAGRNISISLTQTFY
ncbi:TonB-dependent receptor [Galbibacter sp. PAP.153]|uniref:TonB-dependent receptor n=1 Tax=Galbibacter sp. PAP.153 TaxID=3104623 RepID=UPI003009375F